MTAPTTAGGRAGFLAENIIWLHHGKARLALHLLHEGWGRPLLILPGLGETAPPGVAEPLASWTGPVYSLEVTGHGRSSRAPGGGYSAEVLMADVDAALAHLGSATVYGRGLGAYLALLISGGRADLVRGAILADGPGLLGGGIRPGSPYITPAGDAERPGPDPLVMAEMSRDVRPPDYAVEYVRQALQWSGLDHPIAVTAVVRPEWLRAVVAQPGVIECTVAAALARYTDARPADG